MTTPTSDPITGRESSFAYGSPHAALSEFYRAFNARDLALMERNWLPTSAASMDNPLGGIRRGWSEIRPVYKQIFAGTAHVEVEFFDYTIEEAGTAFVAIGRERGTVTAASLSLDLMIRTSRVFVRADERWRQLHHHGSIEDADLLTRYQAAVR